MIFISVESRKKCLRFLRWASGFLNNKAAVWKDFIQLRLLLLLNQNLCFSRIMIWLHIKKDFPEDVSATSRG